MPQCTNHQVKPLFYCQGVEKADIHYSGLISLLYHDPKGECFSGISNRDVQKPEYGKGNDGFLYIGYPDMKTHQIYARVWPLTT